MEGTVECMCTECGISVYIQPAGITSGDMENARGGLMENTFCPRCGGALILVGRAGEEPFYRTE